MNKNYFSLIKKGLFLTFIIFLVSYSFIQTKSVLFGPKITIYSPINGETYKNSLLEIKGKASNTNLLTLNDRHIFTDQEGYFKEKLILSTGYNIIIMEARDKFGERKKIKLEVVCNCEN